MAHRRCLWLSEVALRGLKTRNTQLVGASWSQLKCLRVYNSTDNAASTEPSKTGLLLSDACVQVNHRMNTIFFG